MDGTVLVAVVGLFVLGILGVIALTRKGRVRWESGKVEIEGEHDIHR